MIEALTVFAAVTALACVVAVLCRVAWPVVRWYIALNERMWHAMSGFLRTAIFGPPPKALPSKVWCTCGSRDEAVPVEVHDGAEPEVVAWLCPECREERRPPGEPVMTDTGPECHNCAEPWSMALDAPRECDRCEAPLPATLPEVHAEMNALAESWSHRVTTDGSFVLSQADYRRYKALVERGKDLRDAAKVLAEREARRRPRCPDGEHEWEDTVVKSHASSVPVRVVRTCVRCDASPPEFGPSQPGPTPDDAEDLWLA